MHYKVIVSAEIQRKVSDPKAQSLEFKLLSAIFTPTTKIISEGTLSSSRDGRITLKFKSADGCETTISFAKAEPDLVAVTHVSNPNYIPRTFFLESGKTHKCFAKNPSGEKMEYTVKTEYLENRLLKAGKMLMDYSIEICGLTLESTSMKITVIHDKEDN